MLFRSSICGKYGFYVESLIITDKQLKEKQFLSCICKRRKDKDLPEEFANMDNKLGFLTYSLALTLSSFSPQTYIKCAAGVTVMNLMTSEQLHILQKCKAGSHILLIGWPGSGKTIIGLEWAKWHRCGDVSEKEVQFVTFSHMLAQEIR